MIVFILMEYMPALKSSESQFAEEPAVFTGLVPIEKYLRLVLQFQGQLIQINLPFFEFGADCKSRLLPLEGILDGISVD